MFKFSFSLVLILKHFMQNILNFKSQVHFKALWNLRGKRESHRGYIFTLTNQDINPDYCNKLFLLFEQSTVSHLKDI